MTRSSTTARAAGGHSTVPRSDLVQFEATPEAPMAEDPSRTRPGVVDRAAFEQELEVLRAREKAHTREGDAIAAARRRLPMVDVAAESPLLGPHGPVTL